MWKRQDPTDGREIWVNDLEITKEMEGVIWVVNHPILRNVQVLAEQGRAVGSIQL